MIYFAADSEQRAKTAAASPKAERPCFVHVSLSIKDGP